MVLEKVARTSLREHILKQDAVLHRMVFPVAFGLANYRLNLLALSTGAFTLCRSFFLFSQSVSLLFQLGLPHQSGIEFGIGKGY